MVKIVPGVPQGSPVTLVVVLLSSATQALGPGPGLSCGVIPPPFEPVVVLGWLLLCAAPALGMSGQVCVL